MFRVSNCSQSPVFGAFAASPCSDTARRVSAIRTALATGRRYGLLLVTILLGLCAVGARAQTASFSYAIAALGGGFGIAEGVAVDRSGNVYVADTSNNAVKEMPAGCASSSCVTMLGGGFSLPFGVAVDRSGNVYVADTFNSAVKEMPAGCASSSCVTKLGGGFMEPAGVAVDGRGNVYVADGSYNAVYEIPAGCASSSCVTMLGGGFLYPHGVAVDGSGNVYVADADNNAVKEMPAGCASSSCVTTLGGGFMYPYGVAVDASGNVYVGDYGNSAVKEMPAGCASTNCVTALGGTLNFSYGVAVDSNGNVFVASAGIDPLKEIVTRGVNFFSVPVGTATTPLTLTFTFNSAGSLNSTTPFQVLTQGAQNLDFAAAPTQESNACNGTTAYAAGSTCTVNVTFTPTKAGPRYGAVELLNAGGSTIATAYVYGTGQGPQVVFSPPAQSTQGGGFNGPTGAAVDSSGNIFVADTYNNAVKEMPAGCASSICATTLGGGFFFPEGVGVDGSGKIYVADTNNSAVKEMPAGCASSSCVTTLGGGFLYPNSVAVDGSGNVYVADSSNNAVKEMPAGCASSSCVTTLGGGFSYPQGVAVDASGNVYVADTSNTGAHEMPAGCTSSSCVTALGGGFNQPFGVAVDASGNVYIADFNHDAVYEMPAGCASSTCVTTLAGGLAGPTQLALDGNGNVYVADQTDGTVVELNRATPPSLSFATTTVGSTSSDGPQTVQIANIGNQPLIFTTPTSGSNPSYPANFPKNTGDTILCASGTPLAQGSSCDVSVNFKPTSGGTNSGSVLLTDNALNQANATQSIPLSGLGVIATAALTSPTPNSQLASSSVTFTWSAGIGVTYYWLNLGTAASGVNAKNIYSSGSVKVLAETVTGLPANGETLYATLYSYLNAAWQPTVYTFYATGPAVLTAPAAGTKLTASTTFTWTPGTGIAHYWFNLGTAAAAANAKNIYSGGSTTATSVTVTGIPQYGEAIYATLYSYISGAWQPIVYTYTAGSPVAAALTTPTPSTKLASSSVTFAWSGSEGVAYYWFNLGTASSGANAKTLYSSGSTTLSAVNVTGLPTNGETIYATLYSYIAGVWQPTVYSYTASGSPTPATLTTPAPSSTLTSSTVTFTWSAANPATYYWFNLGTASSGANAKNLYSGSPTTATSVTVSGLPTNGETIYATLYSYIGGAWQPTVYTYKAQ
jgi:sugar lactone lactonase YvrE